MVMKRKVFSSTLNKGVQFIFGISKDELNSCSVFVAFYLDIE